jgi:hypothetical protein
VEINGDKVTKGTQCSVLLLKCLHCMKVMLVNNIDFFRFYTKIFDYFFILGIIFSYVLLLVEPRNLCRWSFDVSLRMLV